MKISKAATLLVMLALNSGSFASTFFFPENRPVYSSVETPKWLRDGHGNDGYVTVTSEVIPASSCVPLSNHSFWGGEKTQLVLSITSNGFKNKLDNSETPIAAFDGRDNGSQCATLSTMPVKVVPQAILGSFSSFNPGDLSLVLNVKSSSDSNQDFIGSAKLLLGAAAMVASGGAAVAIGGIASTVGNPVLSEAQTRTNALLNWMVNGKTQISLNWPMLRNGIRSIEIPVYRAESGLSGTADKKIMTLQADNKSEKTTLFTVRLSFNYTHTLFDPAASETSGLPNPDNISTSSVLNYQVPDTHYNFLQALNDSSPSLLQAVAVAEGQDLSHACSIGIDKLKKIGLSNIDTAIVLKSFIDEAKGGSDWYNNPVHVKSCFTQAPGVQLYLEKIYGASAPKFVIGDVQNGIGKAYQDWREKIGPTLSNFRSALLAKQDRLNVLANFNGKRDIKVLFSPDIESWPEAINPNVQNSYPGLEKLANRQIKTTGCFIYKDAENLDLSKPGAYFILEDVSGNFWLNKVNLVSAGPAKISNLTISNLSTDWEKYFESYNFPGGECAGILARFKNKKLRSQDNPLTLSSSQPATAAHSVAAPLPIQN